MLGAISFGNVADAITYGVPDDGAHPNVVSIASFRETTNSNGDPILFSSGRCSGSLIRKDDDMLVFLTAGHCPQFWLEGLQHGSLVDVGVSFDEVIDKDLGVTASSTNQYILGGNLFYMMDIFQEKMLGTFNSTMGWLFFRYPQEDL
jgi:hypothetical protein